MPSPRTNCPPLTPVVFSILSPFMRQPKSSLVRLEVPLPAAFASSVRRSRPIAEPRCFGLPCLLGLCRSHPRLSQFSILKAGSDCEDLGFPGGGDLPPNPEPVKVSVDVHPMASLDRRFPSASQKEMISQGGLVNKCLFAFARSSRTLRAERGRRWRSTVS